MNTVSLSDVVNNLQIAADIYKLLKEDYNLSDTDFTVVLQLLCYYNTLNNKSIVK